MLEEIRRLTRFANEYEDDFAQAIVGRSMKTAERDRVRKQKELDGLLARDKELDVLFERIYEDNAAGKISDERFPAWRKSMSRSRTRWRRKSRRCEKSFARRAAKR